LTAPAPEDPLTRIFRRGFFINRRDKTMNQSQVRKRSTARRPLGPARPADKNTIANPCAPLSDMRRLCAVYSRGGGLAITYVCQLDWRQYCLRPNG
jgi:hypothetical protein